MSENVSLDVQPTLTDTHQCHHHDVGGFASYFMLASYFHILVGSGTYLFILYLSYLLSNHIWFWLL